MVCEIEPLTGLRADNVESVGESLSLSLSLPLPHLCALSLSLPVSKKKKKKKKVKPVLSRQLHSIGQRVGHE